ncbi:hypothetical protein CLAFUW4_03985 [Fulvia fulva]|uniref:Uncharacterized protein n=1 Tax=Passalora fulva TaxID=5499 RepID=A0A9Q8LGN8_PASFU|nr:uncharacterized protein CLAFUR5_03949 [Fulvia fulva]KAK4627050.1 hypothetical protein CLAFUR4_03971 [Fulvia fulva]KAK4627977.1 hypothetical protein CLAFUR0_03972 [Fulvia fulva]UJO17073.1 hypothetical protein CLAFUR5_03949 [Fulvia fulva]WPV13796.1 hypothetical protein CLAFUW4_03985 [Fulvia fulva]WPV29024.1 hypothetical protein CLAFUW7_03974 [Fulvia fulva]
MDDEYHIDLVKRLQQLVNAELAKICVASRELQVFRRAFDRDAHHMTLDNITLDDIDKYVQSRLESFQCSLSKDEKEELGREIRIRAEGVFQWVKLVVNLLRKGLTHSDNLKTLRDRLNSCPKDIMALYRRIFADIETLYRPHTAMVLLSLRLSGDQAIPLLWLAFLEDYIDDNDFAIKMPLRPFNENDMAACYDLARQRAKIWCGDLVSADSANNEDLPLFCMTWRDGLATTALSLAHRTCHDFLDTVYDQLRDWAGLEFDEGLLDLFIMLRFLKGAVDKRTWMNTMIQML